MADQLTATAAETRRLSLGGRTLACLDTGGDRPVLLLVPGYTGSKEDFAPLLDPLRDNGFRAVAIDQPGQYESPGPDDETWYTVDNLGAVVAEAVRTLVADGTPVVLLGHSFGWLVARAAVLAGAPVSGLVALCGGPAALTYGPRIEALALGAPILREYGVAAAWSVRAATTDALIDPAHPEPAALVEFRRERFLATSAASLLGMGAALTTEPDRTQDLATVLAGRPVAVVTGEHDDAWTVASQTDMARRLGVTQLLIPDSAHSPAVENPDALVACLVRLLTAWL